MTFIVRFFKSLIIRIFPGHVEVRKGIYQIEFQESTLVKDKKAEKYSHNNHSQQLQVLKNFAFGN